MPATSLTSSHLPSKKKEQGNGGTPTRSKGEQAEKIEGQPSVGILRENHRRATSEEAGCRDKERKMKDQEKGLRN